MPSPGHPSGSLRNAAQRRGKACSRHTIPEATPRHLKTAKKGKKRPAHHKALSEAVSRERYRSTAVWLMSIHASDTPLGASEMPLREEGRHAVGIRYQRPPQGISKRLKRAKNDLPTDGVSNLIRATNHLQRDSSIISR
jgi:hypothetical protein